MLSFRRRKAVHHRLEAVLIALAISCAAPALAQDPRPATTVAMSAAPIFGEREIHLAGIAPFYKWTAMLSRWASQVKDAQECGLKTGDLNRCLPPEWAQLTARLRGLAPRVMLDEVNRAINAHPYVAATDNWGDGDHWETPFEFLSRNGQCEDYAIAKFMLLRAMGFSNDQLRVVVVRDVARQVDHAVLVVQLGGQTWLLDSVTNAVDAVASAAQYRAYYSINETGWWLPLPNPIGIGRAQLASLNAG
jgi:predicted transglutaminase-like cysteine proteinase